MAKLFRVILPVADLGRAVSFYAVVLGQKGQRVSPGRHYIDCEGTILACYDPKADGDGYEAQPIPEPVYLAVDDLEATFRRAKEAGALFSPEVRSRRRTSRRDRAKTLGGALLLRVGSVRQSIVLREP